MRLINKFLAVVKEDILAYALLAFGFLFRLFYIFLFTTPEKYLWSDPGGYDQRALQMAKDQYIMFSTYWPPFFHMVLSLIYRPLVWLGIENWRIKIDVVIFALLYIVGFWCIYQIAKKLFSKKTALIVLLILILWYPFIFLNYVIMSENLFFPLIFLGLYFLITRSEKPLTGFWLGLFWGLATITRPIFILALPLFVLWGLYYKINWRLLINFVIVTAIIIASMMLFNFYYTKGAEKSISSSGGFNFAMSWCDVKSVGFKSNGYYFWFASVANIDYPDSKKIFTDVPFENQKYYYQIGLNCIKKNPEILLKNFYSAVKLFHSHLFPTVGNVAYWENFRATFKFLIGLFLLFDLLAILGFLTKKIQISKETEKYLCLMLLIVLSLPIIIYLQNVGEERYLIPYEPLLIILAIPAINSLFKFT